MDPGLPGPPNSLGVKLPARLGEQGYFRFKQQLAGRAAMTPNVILCYK